MGKRLVSLLMLAVILGACEQEFRPQGLWPRASRVGEELGEKLTLAQVRAHLDQVYRVPPDRRFLLALEELAAIVEGEAFGRVEAQWGGHGMGDSSGSGKARHPPGMAWMGRAVGPGGERGQEEGSGPCLPSGGG